MPRAIAASLVYPDHRVPGIADGTGFLLNAEEIETARRLQTNFVMLVWEEKEYGLVKWKQQAQFGRHTDLAFDDAGWMTLAGAFGWHGHLVTDSRQFAGVLIEPGLTTV